MTQQTVPASEDLNQIIAAAVTARVEAAVAAALTGDETIGAMVIAALQQNVEVTKPGGYGKVSVPFLNHLIQSAIRSAAESAVRSLLEEEKDNIETEVRKHMRRHAPDFAATMVGQLVDAASKSYGVAVTLRLPGE